MSTSLPLWQPAPRRAERSWVWAAKLGVLVLVIAELVLLAWTPMAQFGFFLVCPLLWVVHDSMRGGMIATLSFAAAVIVVALLTWPEPWDAVVIAVITSGYSMFMGLWIWRESQAREAATAALAAKNDALDRLAQAQEGLAAVEREAGRQAERERWSRDVHDTLAQGFVSVITLSEAARAELGPRAPQPVLRRLDELEQVARENLAEARALVEGSGPSRLRSHGLEAALQRLGAAQEAHGCSTEMTLRLPPHLTQAIQVVVLRTVQESLSNVARHARARTARVLVEQEATPGGVELVVRVSDDGVGIGGRPEGVGQSGMRSRVEAVGGSLTIDPLHAPDDGGRTGTVVEARIPL